MGQPEFTGAGQTSIHLFKRSSISQFHDTATTPLIAYYFGSVDPSVDPVMYLKGIHKCLGIIYWVCLILGPLTLRLTCDVSQRNTQIFRYNILGMRLFGSVDTFVDPVMYFKGIHKCLGIIYWACVYLGPLTLLLIL